MSRARWGWLALAFLAVLLAAWMNRYDVQRCGTDGCLAVDRLTGSVVVLPRMRR